MSYSNDAKSTKEKGRNEQGEMDIVRFSWDRSEATSTPDDITNYYSEIQSQLENKG